MTKEALYAALEARIERNLAAAARHRADCEWVGAAVAQAWADSASVCLDDARDYLADEPEPNEYDAWVEAAVGAYVP